MEKKMIKKMLLTVCMTIALMICLPLITEAKQVETGVFERVTTYPEEMLERTDFYYEKAKANFESVLSDKAQKRFESDGWKIIFMDDLNGVCGKYRNSSGVEPVGICNYDEKTIYIQTVHADTMRHELMHYMYYLYKQNHPKAAKQMQRIYKEEITGYRGGQAWYAKKSPDELMAVVFEYCVCKDRTKETAPKTYKLCKKIQKWVNACEY